MLKEKIILKIDRLIVQAENIGLEFPNSNDYETANHANYIEFKAFKASCLNSLQKILSHDNAYYEGIASLLKSYLMEDVVTIISILNNLKDDVNDEWIGNFKGIISAEIFSDYLDMSGYLLEEGYKDAAAVMIGSTLEEHLRQLAIKQGEIILITSKGKPVKADTINGELKKHGVYNLLNQKDVTAWLDLRNNAAHGKYDQYTIEQVKNMLVSVRDFIKRNAI